MQTVQKQAPSGGQQLTMISKKYYLPCEIQFEKDVVVITYKDSIKQLIYHGCGYIMHRNRCQLYDMSGKMLTNVPRLLKYIVENRVEIQ